jgi:hypothetical protein
MKKQVMPATAGKNAKAGDACNSRDEYIIKTACNSRDECRSR